MRDKTCAIMFTKTVVQFDKPCPPFQSTSARPITE